QRTTDRGQRTADRGQRTTDRAQRTADRAQRIPDYGTVHFTIGPRGSVAVNVPVSGTPIGPTGMYTTVWFGEFTIIFCASIASCWMYIVLNCPRMICIAFAMPCACTSRFV